MRTHPLDTVLDGHMCAGCGACAFLGHDSGVHMVDIPAIGTRPMGTERLTTAVKDQIFTVCPGARVRSPAADQPVPVALDDMLIGPTCGIWEGWATDPDLRKAASSGGVVTALAAYCVEQLGMRLVVHTGMDPRKPWSNRTIISRHAAQLEENCGSRYAPSSPVEALRAIEESDRPCVFIGKPCDVSAVAELRRCRPTLDRNLGLVLSFFCAGTPSTEASLGLARRLGYEKPDEITSVKYRGDGWPGRFRVHGRRGREASLSYEESWGALARRHRQLRCHVCPDGLGELSDVTGGDAWHRKAEGGDGVSIVLARTQLGRRVVEEAAAAGYLTISPSDAQQVVAAQGLVRRRKLLAARTTALRIMGVRTPHFVGFRLWRVAYADGLTTFARELLGMMKRVFTRGYRKPERTDGKYQLSSHGDAANTGDRR